MYALSEIVNPSNFIRNFFNRYCMIVSATLQGVRKNSMITIWRNGKLNYVVFNFWSPLPPPHKIKLLKAGKCHSYSQKYLYKTKVQTSFVKLSTVILTQKLGETIHFRLVVAQKLRVCVIYVHNCQIISENKHIKIRYKRYHINVGTV
jgi:hypothetical protein